MNLFRQITLPALTIMLLTFCSAPRTQAQLTVNGNATAAQLAATLTGSGVVISNVTRSCPGGASGSFNGTNSTLGLNSGALLTTGSLNIAAQPNLSGAESLDNFAGGDLDLNAISGQQTFDACILEFDLVATCDTISISYVFASEEYDEFVCASVNDVFAFIINGPGLNNVNIATVPGTTTPVTINTVNNGSVGTFGTTGPGCILGNSAFFTTNTGTSYEYDGRTIPMVAKTWVAPCSTYHIKLAIADGGDGELDSGVFLEAGGIACASPQIEVNTATIGNSNYLVEGCTDGLLYFKRTGNLSTNFTVQYSVGGTATNGTDYPQIPTSVTFAPGIDSVSLLISPQDDGLVEGPETITIILRDSVCSTVFADTSEVLVVDPPQAAFAFSTVCQGQLTQFTDNSTFYGTFSSWQWDFGDGGTANVQNPTHVYQTPGTYTATLWVETSEGCRDSLMQTVEVYSLPTAAFSVTDFCVGHPTNFTDASTQAAPDVLSNWAWDFGNGSNSTQQNPSPTYNVAGTYQVQLIVTNGNGCRDTVVQSIDIHPSPQPDFSWADVCLGSEMIFTDQSTTATGTISSWDWSFGDGGSATTANTGHTYADTGTYQVQLITTSSWGCIDSITHAVDVFPNPVPDFDVSFACLGDSSYFTDLSTLSEGNIVTWNWDFGDGQTSTDQNPAHVYWSFGNFVITLEVISDQGCSTILRREISRPPRPDRPIVTHDTICVGESATLLAAAPGPGGGPAENLYWYETPTGTQHIHRGNSFETGPLSATRPYFVAYISPAGCWSDRVPVFARVEGPPQLQLSISNQALEIPHAIAEFGVFDPATVASFFWQFGDGGSSTEAQPVYQYHEAGNYLVTLNVIGHNGCMTDYTLGEIVVEQHFRLFIPTAFTPNGDGLNDVFEVGTRLLTALEIGIYDRWGKLIFSSRDLGFAWNGKDISGADLAEGVYAYKVRAVAVDGSVIDRSGTVTLIR